LKKEKLNKKMIMEQTKIAMAEEFKKKIQRWKYDDLEK